MSRFPRNRPSKQGQASPWILAGLALLILYSGGGCGREFFRQWADQDVTEAVFEKSRDPRWNLPLFTVEPPAMSRFAEPWDPDRPPAPPDDPAAEALSPVPQMPHIRLLTPAEGDGYNDLMESGTRYNAPPSEEEQTRMNEMRGIGEPGTTPPPPVPGPGPSPLAPPGPGVPPVLINPDAPASGTPPINPEGNSGTTMEPLTPNTRRDFKKPPTAPGATPSVAASTPPQARPSSRPKRDPGVQQAAFQAPSTPPTAPAEPGAEPVPVQEPGVPPQTEPTTPTGTLPDGNPIPPFIEDTEEPARGDLRVDINQRPIGRPGMTEEEMQGVRRQRASFASVLSPAFVEFNQATTAGLPANSRPYVVNPAQALQLALMNSRAYQYRIENMYVQSLTVTLNRFAFQPQFYAGMSPLTGVATPPGGVGGSFPAGGNGINQFVYRTKYYPGGPSSLLNLSEAAGFGKLLSFGGRLMMGFANTMLFNFTGHHVIQPTVNSLLPMTFIQPFLRGGGRAVTLEPLTAAERRLLYEVRAFARFRQQFFVSVLAGSAPNVTTAISNSGGLGGGVIDPQIGYLTVIQNFQLAENFRRVVAAYERSEEIYQEYARGGASSGISQLQVDQIGLSLQGQRQSLIGQQVLYQNSLDQYKQQLGLPPDVPMILDIGPLQGFRNVFKELDEWVRVEDHDPRDLPGILNRLPKLPNLVLDGRQLFNMSGRDPQDDWADPEKREEFLLVAERMALENRLDLMNTRATLYDVWRQIAVTANALLPYINITVSNAIATPPTTTNPFAFVSEAKQFNAQLQAELPLVRVNERNGFRTALINYQRQRRILMQYEDSVKYAVRSEIRNLIQYMLTYQISIRNLEMSLRVRDQSLQQIIAPPESSAGANIANQATQTNNYISAINNVVGYLNSLVQQWVIYQTTRLALYRDLGIMPFDEWEAYYELFPATTGRDTGAIGTGGNPADPSANIVPAPAAPQP